MHNKDLSLSFLIADQSAYTQEAAASAAAALMDDSSLFDELDFTPEPKQPDNARPTNNSSNGQPKEKRAEAGADSTIRATSIWDLELSEDENEEDEEKTFTELKSSSAQLYTSSQPDSSSYERPRIEPIFLVNGELFRDLDFVPGPSTSLEDENEDVPNDDEEEWVQYYYELRDPNEDILEQVQKEVEEAMKREAETSSEFSAIMLEKASMDHLEKERKHRKTPRYKVPGQKEHTVFVCFVCSRGFLDLELMRTHIEKSHLKSGPSREFKCRFCARLFARKKNLLAHEEKHRAPVDSINQCCKVCDKKYTTVDSLERHMSEAHNKYLDGTNIGKKSFKCDTCGKTFGLQQEKQYHSYYCSRSTEIKQQRAEKKVLDMVALGRDPQSPVNGRIKMDKSCPICGLLCASNQSKNRHIQRKHAGVDISTLATVSPVLQRAPTNEDLATRPFHCAICDAAFTTRAGLTIHERREHNKDPSKMYPCLKCGRTYPLQAELRKHEKKNVGLAMCRSRGRGGSTPSSTMTTPATSVSRSVLSSPSLSIPLTPNSLRSIDDDEAGPTTLGIDRVAMNTPVALPTAAYRTTEDDSIERLLINRQCNVCDKIYTSMGFRDRHMKKFHPGVVILAPVRVAVKRNGDIVDLLDAVPAKKDRIEEENEDSDDLFSETL